MTDRLKIGVIGVGRMGLFHLKKYLEMPDVEVVGVFEASAARAAEVQASLGVRVFENLAELLFESDAVIVASPTTTHFEMTRHALEAGTHVLVEKPIAETVAEGQALVRLAEKQGLVLQVGFLERFRFRALVDGLSLSRPKFVESARFTLSPGRESSIDVVSDLMIHDLDLALAILPGEPREVFASGMPLVTSKVDLANARLEFPGGMVANLNASRVSVSPARKFWVFTDEGYAALDFTTNRVDLCRRSSSGTLDHSVVEASQVDALSLQSRAFVQCVRESGKPVVTGEEAVRSLSYATLIRQRIEERSSAPITQRQDAIDSARNDSSETH